MIQHLCRPRVHCQPDSLLKKESSVRGHHSSKPEFSCLLLRVHGDANVPDARACSWPWPLPSKQTEACRSLLQSPPTLCAQCHASAFAEKHREVAGGSDPRAHCPHSLELHHFHHFSLQARSCRGDAHLGEGRKPHRPRQTPCALRLCLLPHGWPWAGRAKRREGKRSRVKCGEGPAHPRGWRWVRGPRGQ